MSKVIKQTIDTDRVPLAPTKLHAGGAFKPTVGGTKAQRPGGLKVSSGPKGTVAHSHPVFKK